MVIIAMTDKYGPPKAVNYRLSKPHINAADADALPNYTMIREG